MQNQLGVYYAYLATSDTVGWLVSLERAKAAGLDILEISAPRMRQLTPQARWEIADHATRLGLRLTLATALAPETDVSSESHAIRVAGTRQLVDDIRMARGMGALAVGGILTGVGKHLPPDAEHTREAAVSRATDALHEAANAAQAEGVALCLEVVNRFESPLINTCAQALAVVEAVGNPWLGVHLDTFHMNIEEADPAAAIRLAGARLLHFHACENNRSLPGHGHIDWAAVFAALQDIRYGGPIVMEAMAGPVGSFAGRLNIWRTYHTDVDGDLAAATRFLHERMAKTHEL